MSVLLIEDDVAVGKAIGSVLNAQEVPFSTTKFSSSSAIKKQTDSCSLIILGTKSSSGYEALLHLRAENIKAPVLIISSIAGAAEKIQSLNLSSYSKDALNNNEAGSKNIEDVVLMEQSVIKVDEHLVIDRNERVIIINGVPLDATAKEFAIIELLALNPDKIVTKEAILNHLYDGVAEPESAKIIDVFVFKLRQKMLSAYNKKEYVKTKWGRGYVLETPENIDKPIENLKVV